MATISFKQKVVIENPSKCVEVKTALAKDEPKFKNVKPANINDNKGVVSLWFKK